MKSRKFCAVKVGGRNSGAKATRNHVQEWGQIFSASFIPFVLSTTSLLDISNVSVSRVKYSNRCFRENARKLDASFDLHSRHPALQKFLRDVTQRHPFDTFMLVDVLNDPAAVSVRRKTYCGGDSPLMHQDDLRLPADLRMDAHGKDERVILSVCEVELLHP